MEQQHKWPRGAKNIIGIILLIFLAGTFLFSAYTKLIAIEPFEWTFTDMGFPAGLSIVLARLFIGFEFLLGSFLLFHIRLKRFTYPAILIFLGVLTLYLLLLIWKRGNTGDCGCFGNTLRMSPLWAIVKNIGLCAVTWLLLEIYPVAPYRRQGIVAIVAGLASMLIPFGTIPLIQQPQPVNLNALYHYPDAQPSADLRKGKHVIAFMSLGCPHCRSAAAVFRDMYAADTSLPLYMVLNGPESQLEDFFKETRATGVPHFFFLHTDEFIKMAGQYVPSIYWVNNSMRERKVSYLQLNGRAIKDWSKRQ